MAASIQGTSGYARGWSSLNGKVSVALSGSHYFYEIGALNLSAGFLRIAGHCAAPGSYGTYGRVYLFWHVWVFDVNLSTYVSQGNSGYLWDSGNVGCGVGGWARASSPAIVKSFNTSSYLYGYTSYKFVGHVYQFTLFIGCTMEISVGRNISALSTFGSFCNSPTTASANSITISALGVV